MAPMIRRHPRARRGLAIVEITAASVLLIACFALLAQLLFLIAREDRAIEARQAATCAVANELEAVMARDWADLGVGEPLEVDVPPQVLALLPSASMRTHIEAGAEEGSKRIRVEIDWTDASGNTVAPISLTAWKHRRSQDEQP
jgi:hypothetical protein